MSCKGKKKTNDRQKGYVWIELRKKIDEKENDRETLKVDVCFFPFLSALER